MASQSQPYRWLTTTSEGLTFRSCGIGDLEEMLHTIKNAPSFALGMKRIDLSLAYDTARDSRFVEFAEGWAADRGIEVDVRPDTDGDFESEGEGEKEVGDDNEESQDEDVEVYGAGGGEYLTEGHQAGEAIAGTVGGDDESILSKMHETVGNFALVKAVAQIGPKEPIPEVMYRKATYPLVELRAGSV